MNKITSILGGIALAFVFSISVTSTSAQQICVSVGGQPGTIQGGICIPTGGGGQNGYINCPNGTRVPQGYPCPNTNTVGGPAYTQGQYQNQNHAADLSFFGNLIAGVGGIVRMLPPILLGIAVVIFFYFLIKYLIAGKNDPKDRAGALKGLLYSLLAIFIMVALWGIIAFFGDALGINPNTQVNAIRLP